MSEIKTILFDLDGTLTDPKEGITKCVQHALSQCGIEEPDLERLTCFIGPPLQESFEEFYGMDREQSAFALARYRDRFSTVGMFENRLIEGMDGLLETLKRAGKRLAVATSKPTVFSGEILKHFGVLSYFDCLIGSELDGRRTDKGEVILAVLEAMEIPETEKSLVWMVGDRKFDIEGAHRAGIRAAGVRFGYAEPGELEAAGADFTADTVEELKAFLMGE